MKKILSIVLMLALVLCVLPTALAEDPTPIMEVFNCSEYVSLRESPDTASKRLAKVYKGELVYFYAEPDGSEESFYQVEYNGKVGYILSKYLKGTDIYKNSSIMPNQELCNCTDGVYLRAEPDDDAEHLVKVPVGAIVTRCIGGNSTWVQCTYKNKTGYIKQKYLKKADYNKKHEEEEKKYPKEPIDCMQVVHVSDWLALRQGPGTEYKKIAQIPAGAYVTDCLYVNAHWVHLTYEGQTGYAYAQYLTKATMPEVKHVGFNELAPLPSYYSFRQVGDEVLDEKIGTYHIAVRRAYTDNSEQLLAVCYDFVEKPLWTAFEEHQEIEQVDVTSAFIAGTAENPYLVIFNAENGFTARAIDDKGTLLWQNNCADQGTAQESVLPSGGLTSVVAEDGTIFAAGFFNEAPIAIDVNGNLLWSGINPDPANIFWPYEMTVTEEGLVVLYDSVINGEGLCFSVTYDIGNGTCIGFTTAAAPAAEEEPLG